MFKKILCTLMMVLPLAVMAQNVKIGIVDVDAVVSSLPEFVEAQKQLKDINDKYEAEAKKLSDEMNKKLQEYQQLKDDALPAVRQRMEADLQDNNSKFEQFYQLAQQDIQKKQQELLTPIIEKVRLAIQSVGQEGNYTLIESYQPDLLLYYQAPAVDITAEVKAKLGVQ